MLISAGTLIVCRNGAAGRLKYVVIDPDDGAVSHLIIAEKEFLDGIFIVPVFRVERVREDEILLAMTIEDMTELPEYKESDFIEPPPGYHPLSGHSVEETRMWVNPTEAPNGGKLWIVHLDPHVLPGRC